MRHPKSRRNGALPPFVDPAFAHSLAGERDGPARQKPDYKSLQLCRQVQRVLTLELSGAGDDLLLETSVIDVTPAPDASHLLVHVSLPPGAEVVELLARLHEATPRLRAEVARAITRKRAPGLSFIPVAGGEELA